MKKIEQHFEAQKNQIEGKNTDQQKSDYELFKSRMNQGNTFTVKKPQ